MRLGEKVEVLNLVFSIEEMFQRMYQKGELLAFVILGVTMQISSTINFETIK